MAAGAAVVAGMQSAARHRTPFIMFAASGGARMQEGILSLMQMPKTTVAVQELRELGLPAIVDLPDATRVFQTGQRVRLDADRGVLERLSD